MFESLTNKKLVDAYKTAVQLNLEKEFIELLEKEIINRGINYNPK